MLNESALIAQLKLCIPVMRTSAEILSIDGYQNAAAALYKAAYDSEKLLSEIEGEK